MTRIPDSDRSQDSSSSNIGAKKYFWIRLLVLLVVMGSLGFYAWRILDRRNLLSTAMNSLRCYDDLRAIEGLKAVEKKYGRSGDLEFYRARAYRHLNDFEQTNSHLDDAIRLQYPTDKVERERLLGDLQSGRFDTVKDLQSFMTDGAEDFDEVATSVCYGFLSSSRFTDIQKLLGVWKQLLPQSERPYYIDGIAAQNERKWDVSEKLFDECLKRNPLFYPAIRRMAETKLKLNLYAEAAPLYQQLHDQFPNDTEAKLGLAQSLQGNQQAEKALEFLRELHAKGEKDFELILLLGKTELTMGDPKKSIDILLPLVQLWPKDVEANYALSQAYSQVGDDGKAAKHNVAAEEGRKLVGRLEPMIAAAEKDPNDASVRLQIGTVFLHYQSRESGRFWLEAALRVDPNLQLAHRELETYYARIGDVTQRDFHKREASRAKR